VALFRRFSGGMGGKPVTERNFPFRQSYRVLKAFRAIGRDWKAGQTIPPGRRAPFLKRMERRGFIELIVESPEALAMPEEKPTPVVEPEAAAGFMVDGEEATVVKKPKKVVKKAAPRKRVAKKKTTTRKRKTARSRKSGGPRVSKSS